MSTAKDGAGTYSRTHGHNSRPTKSEAAKRQLWATPGAFVHGISVMIGRPIGLDVCAEAHTSKGLWHFGPGGIADDAFASRRPWCSYLDSRHAGFCNPPFVEVWRWSAALQAQRSGLWLLMVPPRTDTEWWHDLVHDSDCHLTTIRGRVRFEPPEGVRAKSPPGGVVLWSIGGRCLPDSIDRDEVNALGERRC